MKPSQSLSTAMLIFSIAFLVSSSFVPVSWVNSQGVLHAQDGEMEYDDDDGDDDDSGRGGRFRQNFNERREERIERREEAAENAADGGQPVHWLNQVLQGMGNAESNEDRFEREEERLDRLWERGRLSDDQYDRLLDSAASRLGVEAQEYATYDPGWQQRQVYWQQTQQNPNLNVEQKKLALEYVKYGDRPLEADKGLVPRPNPLLASPQVYDAASAARLAKTILNGIKDDVAGLQKSLPVGCRTEDAVNLVEKLKKDGAQQALIDTLQGALVDRDTRRFERNAQALAVPTAEIERLLLGMSIEQLQEKLEDKASVSEIVKITEPLARRVDQAELDVKYSAPLVLWLQSVPEMLKTQQELASGKAISAPAWPNGEVRLVFDPQLPSGETRLLPGGGMVAGGNGGHRILVGTGNKYTANGLPVLSGGISAASAPGTAPAKAEQPTLLLDYSGDGTPLKYSIICFQDLPTRTAGVLEAKEAWRQDYTITPGRKQPLPLAWNGRLWYQINCQRKDGTGGPQAYSLKPLPGRSPTYAFRVAGNGVTLVSTPSTVTLDNSLNARPFQFMLGNEYQTIRPGAKQTFDSGVTLQYARNGKTAIPKDAKGAAIANATEESTDISTITLRGTERAVVGVNARGDWEICSGAEIQVAERKSINLPTEGAPRKPEGLATTARGTLYILAIGVSKYENVKQFPPLAFAASDATALTEILKKQEQTLYQSVKPTILTNEQAKVIDVRKELLGLAKKATKNDTVAIVLSGYGMLDTTGKYYFCPYDFDVKKMANKGITSDELQKVTNKLAARNVFVFLDSCTNGGATDTFRQAFNRQISRVGNSGVVVFASTKGTESSSGEQSLGHGALTKAFLNTISDPALDLNKDSIVQVAELNRGLTDGIKNLTRGGQLLHSADLGESVGNLSLVQFNVKK
jgi:hypothetical protein